jgi:hypothetical protein
MITLQKPSEQSGIGTARRHQLHPQGQQHFKRTNHGTLLVLDWQELTIAQPVNRGRSAWRQFNLALGLQLEQEAARGHVLEFAGGIAPVPSRAQGTREPRPIRTRMGLQPSSNQRHFLRADLSPLDDPWSIHLPMNTSNGKVNQ